MRNNDTLSQIVESVRQDQFEQLDPELVRDVLRLHLDAGENERLIAKTRQVLKDWIADNKASQEAYD